MSRCFQQAAAVSRMCRGRHSGKRQATEEEAEAPDPALGYCSFISANPVKQSRNARSQQVHFGTLQSVYLSSPGSPRYLSELFPDGFYL